MKVAFYSGLIPSTVFIENLIKSVSEKNISVIIFGQRVSKIDYNGRYIKVYDTPKHWALRLVYVIFQTITLIILDCKKYFILLKYYKKTHQNKSLINFINWSAKVLPVINNLPDIFHIQWAKSLPDWIFLKEEFGVRIILSLRGTHLTVSPLSDKHLKKQYIRLFPKVDKFHAVSKSLKNLALQYGAKEEDVIVINASNHMDIFNEKNRVTKINNKSINFISIGRFHWIKGYKYALSTMRKLLDNNIPLHYTIIAQDSPSEDILYQIEDDRLKNNVTLAFLDSQEDVYKLMVESDFLILPSIDEGIANVALEAMSVGLIVISSDCGGMKELIDHNKNGFLFSNRNVDDMTETILEILNKDQDALQTIMKNAMQTIKNRYDPSLFGQRMKNLYESVYHQ